MKCKLVLSQTQCIPAVKINASNWQQTPWVWSLALGQINYIDRPLLVLLCGPRCLRGCRFLSAAVTARELSLDITAVSALGAGAGLPACPRSRGAAGDCRLVGLGRIPNPFLSDGFQGSPWGLEPRGAVGMRAEKSTWPNESPLALAEPAGGSRAPHA